MFGKMFNATSVCTSLGTGKEGLEQQQQQPQQQSWRWQAVQKQYCKGDSHAVAQLMAVTHAAASKGAAVMPRFEHVL